MGSFDLRRPARTKGATRLHRAFAVWLTVAAMILVACGDGGSGTGSDPTTGQTGAAGTEDGGSAVSGDIVLYKGPFSENEEQQVGEVIDGFESQHPDVQVTFEQFDFEAMGQQFPTRFMGDDPPDVSTVPDLEFGKWVDRGAFEDLTPYVTDPAWSEHFEAIPDEVWDMAKGPDGKIYGVPWWGVVLSMLFVNTDLAEQAGVNVEDVSGSAESFAEAARKIGALDDETFGFSVRTDQANPASFDWAAWLHTSGARLLNEDWTACAANTPGAQNTLQLVADLIADEGLAPEPGAYDQQGLSELFVNGRVGIAHEASGFVSTITMENPDLQFEVAPIPPGTTGDHSTGMWGVGLLTMSSKSEDKDAAWELISYLSSPDVVVDYFSEVSLLPNRTDVSDRMFEDDPHSKKVVEEILPGAQGWQLHPDLNEMLGRAQPAFDRLYRGQADAAATLEEVCTAVEDVL
ncbi:MAG: sugar ABC transporter substrate-binding protein [Actinobacteria bacterium]|nr:sugar ABC transporter substrate-binding protein [Actinomycetota bacterium]